MTREYTPGSVANIDDFPGDDTLGTDTSPFITYLWGFIIVLAVVLAIREWVRYKYRNTAHQIIHERLWNYVVMALLWPLFISAVLFTILWVVLTRRSSSD